MNNQKLIGKIKSAETLYLSLTPFIEKKLILDLVKQLDEPQPIKLKDVIARIKQLDIGTRKVWLDGFLNELGSDYGTLKYKAGYEQGKFDGAMEREKVTIPQFVAEIIEYYKKQNATLYDVLREKNFNKQYNDWLLNELDAYDKVARAWLDGYEVEKEKRYLVKIKGFEEEYNFLNYFINTKLWIIQSDANNSNYRTQHTRKELEDADFGWVFDCPGVEIEEVE